MPGLLACHRDSLPIEGSATSDRWHMQGFPQQCCMPVNQVGLCMVTIIMSDFTYDDMHDG